MRVGFFSLKKRFNFRQKEWLAHLRTPSKYGANVYLSSNLQETPRCKIALFQYFHDCVCIDLVKLPLSSSYSGLPPHPNLHPSTYLSQVPLSILSLLLSSIPLLPQSLLPHDPTSPIPISPIPISPIPADLSPFLQAPLPVFTFVSWSPPGGRSW